MKTEKKMYLLKMVLLSSELFWAEIIMVVVENYIGNSSP